MPNLMPNPHRIVIHHSATADGRTFSWGAIRQYHMKNLGWDDIGYHAGVELVESGGISRVEIVMGRPWWEAGAHAVGVNNDSLGVCFVGNYDETEPPDEMYTAGAKLLALWMRLYKIPSYAIYPHNVINRNKTCPGLKFNMKRLVEEAVATALQAAGGGE